MKLGLIAGYSGRKMSIPIDAIKHTRDGCYDSHVSNVLLDCQQSEALELIAGEML